MKGWSFTLPWGGKLHMLTMGEASHTYKGGKLHIFMKVEHHTPLKGEASHACERWSFTHPWKGSFTCLWRLKLHTPLKGENFTCLSRVELHTPMKGGSFTCLGTATQSWRGKLQHFNEGWKLRIHTQVWSFAHICLLLNLTKPRRLLLKIVQSKTYLCGFSRIESFKLNR